MEEPVYFQPNHTITLNPNNLKRVYGVTIEFNQEGKDKQILRFEIEVLAKKNKDGKTWLFQFDRRNVFINMKKPNTIAEKLGHECGQVIYPLQIEISGDWTKKKIKSRGIAQSQLTTFEEKTRATYNSPILDKYFVKTWKTLNEPHSYIKAVEQNLFLSFFFAPLYEQYNILDNVTETQMQIPIIPFCKPVSYTLKQKVMPKYTRFNTITVIQDGELTDERTKKDFTHKFDEAVFTGKGQSEKTTGKLQAKYELDKDTRIIQSITAKASIDLPDKLSRSFELQAYYLSERDKILDNSSIAPYQPIKKAPNE